MGRILVTGGAGFVGSHVCAALLERGDEVVCYDNLVTGSRSNVERLADDAAFSFVHHNVSEPFSIDQPLDAVMHLASPASPVDFGRIPIDILQVGSLGTFNTLEIALKHGARFFLASTSEVYGDPEVHPQPETYWGNVNPNGPRSIYDEAKRFAEATTMAYHRQHDVDVRIIRIFNTYGPHMRPDDGRVVSNFLTQALQGEDITVYGDGSQTRSFCYVSDQVKGHLALLDSDYNQPVNVGNDTEFTMLELATEAISVTNSSSQVVHRPLPTDDPTKRRPDLTRARSILGWEPTVALREGLERTAEWFAPLVG